MVRLLGHETHKRDRVQQLNLLFAFPYTHLQVNATITASFICILYVFIMNNEYKKRLVLIFKMIFTFIFPYNTKSERKQYLCIYIIHIINNCIV